MRFFQALIRFFFINIVLSAACFAQEFPQADAVSAVTGTLSPTYSGLHVSGNQLLNAQGQQVVLRGIDRAGTEYMCIQGNGVFDGPSDGASVQAMKSWNINAVLIPLNEDCWLGINGANPGGTAYQQAIINYVQLLESNQIYPILAYMWGAAGTQKAQGHPAMPDADHAPAFWTSVANTFKNDTKVIFRLQEEPHPNEGESTAAWECWKNGGSSCNEGFPVVGFQSLVNTVRATGAPNVLALPGLAWSNVMDQFLTYKPTDIMNNVMAMVDVYPTGNECGNASCWNSQYAPVIAQIPFAAGEFGESVNGDVCGVTGSNAFLSWMDQHNAGYIAWVWDTWGTSCGDLSLITDYKGTPKSPNGTNYKSHLAALANDGSSQPVPVPTPTTTPTPIPTPTPEPSPTATPVPDPTPVPTLPPISTPIPPSNPMPLPVPPTNTGTTASLQEIMAELQQIEQQITLLLQEIRSLNNHSAASSGAASHPHPALPSCVGEFDCFFKQPE